MYKHLPNHLTLLRLVLSAIFFVTLNQYRYHAPVGDQPWILPVAIGLFILAALTDWLDGFLARRWKVESTFGRIMDPFCDKVLIIGAFVYLAGPRFVIPEKVAANEFFNMVSGIYPWMVVVVLARELLVTSVRGEAERRGTKFGANIFGKLKMILQAVAIPVVLLIIWLDPMQRPWTAWVRDVLVYATVAVTVLSGLPYILRAREALSHDENPAR